MATIDFLSLTTGSYSEAPSDWKTEDLLQGDVAWVSKHTRSLDVLNKELTGCEVVDTRTGEECSWREWRTSIDKEDQRRILVGSTKRGLLDVFVVLATEVAHFVLHPRTQGSTDESSGSFHAVR